MAGAPQIVVRVDATPALGWGHLKRCLSLAVALRARGAVLHFVGRSDAEAVPRLMAEQGWPWHALPAAVDARVPDPVQDLAETLAMLPARPDLVLVDHYRLDARWHAAARAATGARIIVIDDLGDRPLAPDLLIDHNPALDHAAKYQAVLPAGVAMCVGPAHALLDPVYANHARAVFSPQVQRIGLFMGGTDPGGHSAWALQALRQRAGWQGTVQLVTTRANPQWRVLRDLARADGRVEFACDLPHLADFHAGQDLQIGAGGGALWERCCLGVPTLALVCADNQRLSVPLLAAAGVVQGLEAVERSDAQAQALADAVVGLIESPDRRAALRAASLALVDGRGAERTAAAVLSLTAAR